MDDNSPLNGHRSQFVSEALVEGEVFESTKRRAMVKRFCVRKQTPEEQRAWQRVYTLFIVDYFFENEYQNSQEINNSCVLLWLTEIKHLYSTSEDMPLGELRAVSDMVTLR